MTRKIPKDGVELIPWNFEDKEHLQRIEDQRLALGWFPDFSEVWKEKYAQGRRFMYWIVLSEYLSSKDELLAEHLRRFPKEMNPVIDTASGIGDHPREPTLKKFVPVGHIGLEKVTASEVAELGLPQSCLWIKALFVSWALQGRSVSRAAMSQAEQIACCSPFNATITALECITEEFQASEWYLKKQYDDVGIPRPQISNVVLYGKLGYQRYLQRSEEWLDEATGKPRGRVPLVVMRKDLTEP
ncbi:E3 ubiquitin-protein ligase ubr1 [Elsinoe australis]|uniref:E3 ubiquitin-protein ligase ubr1 n=1 Tax=Elsinoe australis TaxID=40998 RepID=A0A2P7YBT2_9PEZI|nr:E3 ubiquitin-protein ligase ubr1 [Elsinoe australis]